MSLGYFDASALVKLVVEEDGSAQCATLWDAADAVVTSRVAHAEVCAALAAAARDRRLDPAAYRQALREWEGYRTALHEVEVSRQLVVAAGELAATHALSGFDAVHLASVLALGTAPVVVATWDRRLHRATRRVGRRTLPAAL